MISSKPHECFEPFGGDNGCSLAYLGRGFSRPTGSGILGVAVVGESLGREEVWDSLPFRPQARAGSKFEEVCKLAGVDRKELLVWNIVGCQPPDNRLTGTTYGINAIAHCQVHFDRIILGLRPNPACGKRVILALGSVPLTTLVPNSRGVTDYRGFVLESKKYGLIIGGHHPSWIQRGNFEFTPEAAMDMQRAVAVAKGEFTDYPAHPDFRGFDINEFPSIDEAWGFYYKCRDNERLLITFDIETPKTGWATEEERPDIEDAPIFQIQFSVNMREAIVFPWRQPYIDVAVAILKLDNAKAGHFVYSFDIPKLKSAGVPAINGNIHDTLWCLRGDTKIRLADGTLKYVRDIVNNQESTNVLGMDATNQLIAIKVIGWHKTMMPTQKWLRIRTSARHSSIVTPEHRYWTKSGWEEARNLKVGDYIRDYRTGSDDLIHGTLLGDGNVTKWNMLQLSHGVHQRDYINAKSSHIGANKVGSYTSKRGYTTLYSSALVDETWRKKFYNSEGKKVFIPPPTAKAMAIWYMDDWGWYIVHPRHKSGYVKGVIAGFVNGEEACNWVERFLGERFCKFELRRISNDGLPVYMVTVKTIGMQKLFRAIRSYIHPSMEYKLPPEHRGFYNGWIEGQEPQWVTIKKIDTPNNRGGFSSKERFCITVDHPTHRFFTSAGLVENCFKHWHPRLPRGLQNVAATVGFPFPWKFAFEDKPQWYGGCDVIAVQYILRWLPPRMKKMGIWNGYLEQIRDMYYILGPRPDASKESASDRGIPVNDEAREQLKVDLIAERRELNKELQKLVPDEIKRIEPRRNQAPKGEEPIWDYGYQRPPKKLLAQCWEKFKANGNGYSFEEYLATRLVLKTKPNKDGKSKEFRLKKMKFRGQDENGNEIEVERWYRELMFLASSQQLIGYLNYKRKGLENGA